MADLMYAGENDGYFAPNPSGEGGPPEYGTSNKCPAWVAGNMQISIQSTNADLLVNPAYAPFGSLGVYTKSPDFYHCPADKTTDGGGAPRVRSYSCNAWVGRNLTPNLVGGGISAAMTGGETYLKDTSFNKLKPSECFVFTEQRRVPAFSGDTALINDGWFWSPTPGGANAWTVRDTPQFAHGKAGTYFSFGDGHAELHQWVTTFFKTSHSGDAQLGNSDQLWLLNHSTK
jgi:hypothetical protein